MKMIFYKRKKNSLSEKIKCLKIEYKMLHDKVNLFKEKQSTSFKHEKSLVNELIMENEALKKKSSELNNIVLKFTNGQKNLEK